MKSRVLLLTFLLPALSTMASGSFPRMEQDTVLEGVTPTENKTAIRKYLSEHGWTGSEIEYEVLLDYLSSHVRFKDGQGVWSAKYHTFAHENLAHLQNLRSVLKGKPQSYVDDWVAWYAPRIIGYRIPYQMDARLNLLRSLPQGSFAEVKDLAGLQQELDTRYSFRTLSAEKQSVMAAALAGINPRLIPEGGVAAGQPDESDRWRVQQGDWQTAYQLEDGGPMFFPSASWLQTQNAYRPDIPEQELITSSPTHVYVTLPEAGMQKETLILRLDVEGGKVVSAVAMKEAAPHRIYPVIPLAIDEHGHVLRPTPGAPAPKKKPKLDLDTLDLNTLGGTVQEPLPRTNAEVPPPAGIQFNTPWFDWTESGVSGGGRLRLKTRKGEPYFFEFHLEATRTGSNWTGSYWSRFPSHPKRKNAARTTEGPRPIQSRDIKQGGDAIAGSWSTPWGNDGSGVTDKKTKMIRTPGEARLVWTSSHTIPVGRGPNTRGASRPQTVGMPLSGGWGSPVLEDGTLLLSYFRPSGNIYSFGAQPRNDPLANQALDMMRVHTDEYLHAFDTETGATRWKLRLSNRGVNWMGFNKGGPGTSAGVGDGIAVWLGTTGEVYAADIKTGRLLWMNHIGLRHEQMMEAKRIHAAEGTLYSSRNDFQSAVLVVDGVAVVSDHKFSKDSYRYEKHCGLLGFDLKTGRRLWHLPEVAGRSKFNQGGQLWSHNGTTYVLSSHQTGTHLIEPKTGTILASSDSLINRSWGLISGENLVVGERWNNPDDPKAGAQIAGFRLDPEAGFSALWTLPKTYTNRAGGGVYQNGHVYLSTGKSYDGFLCIEASSGNIVAKHDIKMGGGEHAPFVISMGDLLIGTIDRTHGLILFEADPASLQGSAKIWHLDLATGYCGSVVPVIADGRMIIRSPDRLLCFDLRPESP